MQLVHAKRKAAIGVGQTFARPVKPGIDQRIEPEQPPPDLRPKRARVRQHRMPSPDDASALGRLEALHPLRAPRLCREKERTLSTGSTPGMPLDSSASFWYWH